MVFVLPLIVIFLPLITFIDWLRTEDRDKIENPGYWTNLHIRYIKLSNMRVDLLNSTKITFPLLLMKR